MLDGTAYLRFVEREGVEQWVLFDEDGDWIASSREKWRLQDLGSRSGIIQFGIVHASKHPARTAVIVVDALLPVFRTLS